MLGVFEAVGGITIKTRKQGFILKNKKKNKRKATTKKAVQTSVIRLVLLCLFLCTILILSLVLGSSRGNDVSEPVASEATTPTASEPTTPTASEAPTPTASKAPIPTPTPTELIAEQIFAENTDAVFSLYTMDGSTKRPIGSGFFVSSTGVAITAHHVIDEAETAYAVTEDGRELDVLGYYSFDKDNDNAIIQVGDGSDNFKHVVLGDSDELEIGETLIAIGSPRRTHNSFSYGQFTGIVPQMYFGGLLTDVIYDVRDTIEVAVSIDTGYSGGAMFNTKGEAVAVISNGGTLTGGGIPISRVRLSEVVEGQFMPLPLAPPEAAPFAYVYPFIPTFDSVVEEAVFVMGSPATFTDDSGGSGLSEYEYMYTYLDLDFRTIGQGSPSDFRPNTYAYLSELESIGFEPQHYLASEDGGSYSYTLYNPEHDVSMFLMRIPRELIVFICVSSGNVYELELNKAKYGDSFEQFYEGFYENFYGDMN